MTTQAIITRPIFNMHVTLKKPHIIGPNYSGNRVIFDVEKGYFNGEKLNGSVKASGGDWLLFHGDGSATLDVRVCLETDDGALIYMRYKGRWVTPENLRQKVYDPNTCSEVAKDQYYLRTLIMFETSDSRYHWLNNTVAVSRGYRTPAGISYEVMEVL